MRLELKFKRVDVKDMQLKNEDLTMQVLVNYTISEFDVYPYLQDLIMEALVNYATIEFDV